MFNPEIGKGTQFKKGVSGNPGGRPRSRVLSEALRNRMAHVIADDPSGRTFAEAIADNLVRIASSQGSNAVYAASEIADRLEGRAPQSIQIYDLAADLQTRTDEELEFYLSNSRWPTTEELLLLSQPVEPTEM